MIILLNGEFVPEAAARVSVFDRGFLYGDGLFETILLRHGNPFRWQQHLDRLLHGAKMLRLQLPVPPDRLHQFAAELVRRNQMPDAILRIHLSRGVGPRGYSPKGADTPTLVMSLHSAPRVDAERPPQWKVITSRLRVSDDDPLALCKSTNKLHQVLSRLEAEERGADEALLVNTKGEVAEATSANVFWIEEGRLHTPPLSAGALGGMTRQLVLEVAQSMDIVASETTTTPKQLHHAEGVFLTMTSLGIAEVVALDGIALNRVPMTTRLHAACALQIERETSRQDI